MLTDLRVRDLGVIDDLALELGPGMTALTGETGAGKTLVVEALGLALGGKAAPGLVRAGTAEALVEARFVVDDPDAEGGRREVLLARSLPASGRSRAWLDGRPVPLSALSDSGATLVDIHGQHDQQSLLSAAAQRRALDSFSGADPGPLREARRRLRTIDQRLEALGGDAGQRERELDMLGHQIAEIEAARIVDTAEEETLRLDEERLADLGAHREAAGLALGALEGPGGVGDNGALFQLGQAVTDLGGREPFAEWERRLRASINELDDVASDLRSVVETWDDDPAALAEIQSRRRLFADLRRKYGATLAEVVAFGAASVQRRAELLDAAGSAAALGTERAQAERSVRRAEDELGHRRREAAPHLAEAAGLRLVDLAMPGARFAIEVEDGGAGERVQFLLGANSGEPVQPLARVASGGELARAMLALRLVTMGGPATMIFDEVDAGVGGTAALALGRALREVAEGRQVLVVTHLPQVAAFADCQVAVHKEERDGRTVTGASLLGPNERITELSRMMSGHPDSATARAHATELLSLAQRPAPSATPRRAIV